MEEHLKKNEIGIKGSLDCLYDRYNQRKYVDPDPLLFLYDYPDKKDREIAGFVAACLAYGRVSMIMKTVSRILDRMRPGPFAYLAERTKKEIERDFKGFRYRFASETHLTRLLWGVRYVITRFSSLEDCFYAGWAKEDETVVPGLTFLCEQIGKSGDKGHLVADPRKNSACKRSHLFLRWMVRQDRVDPGGWDRINPSQLIIPLDTHMHRAGTLLGFTNRKNGDLKTALEITRGFGRLLPQDPVRYDFCLTRLGIRKGLSMETLKELVCT